MAGELDVQGINVAELYAKITDAGVTPLDAKLTIGNLLIDTLGRRPRTFTYTTAFPGADDACKPEFARSFQHQDWVDGESVVQAEETTGEEGFNRRFHSIEADLDALGSDVALMFTCMAAMRLSLRSLLDEIRGELNRINAAIADDPRTSGPAQIRPDIEFVGKAKVNNLDKYILREGDQFRLVDFAGPVISPPAKGWADKVGQQAFVDLVASATENIRSSPELDAAIRGGANADSLRASFGDREVATTPTGDAITLGDILADVPAETTFIDAADPAGAVLSAAVRSIGSEPASGLRDSVLTATGQGRTGAELADSPPSVLADVNRDMARDLKTAGVTSVDALARATPDALAASLTNAGVASVDTVAVTRAITAARIARNVRVGG